MAVKIKKGAALGALSITPLIDVVFLLLIFFLVATRFAAEDREMDVRLPIADAAAPLIEEPKEIFINIDESGRFFVRGNVLDADEIEELLERAAINNPLNQSVILRADKRVQLQHAVTVMNLCNRVGIYNYTLTIDGES